MEKKKKKKRLQSPLPERQLKISTCKFHRCGKGRTGVSMSSFCIGFDNIYVLEQRIQGREEKIS